MSYPLGQQMIRVRMAPSPTGRLHIGTARTTLFNYLFAKKNGGEFILRIEDTDKERSKKEFEEEILSYLQWLGISWDEGVTQGGGDLGNQAPYRASERMTIYRPFIEQLLQKGKAFYCFMTEVELDKARKEAQSAGSAFLLRSPYRNLPPVEAENKIATGAEYIIRFKVPTDGTRVIFDDVIRGRTAFSTDVIEDFGIARNLDASLYNFAVGIDDHLMEISHVIRGEDHISNTPKQILLYAALGWEPPKFAHLPLILGPDRSKLSKRHGATSVVDFEAQGYLPEALVNFMAFLGWNPGDAREIFTLSELEKEFDLLRVQKSGAIFNQEKLDWMNAQHIKRLSDEELTERIAKYLERFSSQDEKNMAVRNSFMAYPMDKRMATVNLVKDRMRKLSELVDLVEFLFVEPKYEKELLRWKQMSDAEIVGSLESTKKLLESIPEKDFTADRLDAVLKEYTKDLKDKGSVFWPLRVALTGRKASPSPVPIMGILGKEITIERVKKAIISVEKFA